MWEPSCNPKSKGKRETAGCSQWTKKYQVIVPGQCTVGRRLEASGVQAECVIPYQGTEKQGDRQEHNAQDLIKL